MAPGPLGIRVMRSAVDLGKDASGIHSPAPTSGRVAHTRKGCNVKSAQNCLSCRKTVSSHSRPRSNLLPFYHTYVDMPLWHKDRRWPNLFPWIGQAES